MGCDMHFYKLFKQESVFAVCVHNHPIMIKIHPVKGLSPQGREGRGEQNSLAFKETGLNNKDCPMAQGQCEGRSGQ